MADGSIPESRPAAIPPPGTRGITYGSVCDGMGAAHVASRGLGWSCAWLAEIDPQASAVTAHHQPAVPNLGDITAPGFVARALAVGGLDMLVGGTPCQSFSCAGLRNGLNDDRGNLTLRFVELADATGPDGLPVELVFYENVPGVLSDATNAFGCLLAALVGEDAAIPAPRAGWTNAGLVAGPARTAAWRVLDAQGFVAQRRRRVFVVAARHGSRVDPERVLFETEADALRGLGDRADTGPLFPERKGVRGNIAQGGGAGPGTAIGTLAGTPPGGGAWETGDRVDALTTGTDPTSHLIAFSCKDSGADAGPVSPTLRAMGHDGSHANAGGQVAVVFPINEVGSAWNSNGLGIGAEGGRAVETSEKLAYALTSPNGGGRRHELNVATGMAVRRLTPRECLRLQSFPPDYFDGVTYRGKPLADGPMYKMIGNSWNTDTVRWIFRRIDAQWRGAA